MRRAPILVALAALAALPAAGTAEEAPPAGAAPQGAEAPTPRGATPLFTQDRDNYFVTGLPSTRDWDNLADASRPRIRFQLSVKYNFVPQRAGWAVFFGYTQKSIWDLWNWAGSAPFEDSNYNPALFWAWRPGGFLQPLEPRSGIRFLGLRAGIEHESNGQAGAISRGWNRFSGSARVGLFFPGSGTGAGNYLHLIGEVKGWHPMVEGRDASGGGNPDLVKYYGYGQVQAELGYDIPVEGTVTRGHYQRLWGIGALARASDRFEPRYLEVWFRYRPAWFGWLGLSLFVQGVTGYGETLLRYNVKQAPTVRIGVALDDVLATETLPIGG
jgi:outer membrane phospholipase A